MSIERDLYRLTCPSCGHEGEMQTAKSAVDWVADVTGFHDKAAFQNPLKVLGVCQKCGFEGEIGAQHLRSV